MDYNILNSYHLKIIALIAMVIDHIGYIFFPDVLIFRLIGRMAFIMYAFMLVEGFFNTRYFDKYFIKVFLWAILSELPFDLAMHNSWFYLKEQNIFFSLLLGMIGMFFLNKYKSVLFQGLISIIVLLLAILLRVDYSWYGVGLILLFYFLKQNKYLKIIAAEGLSIYASFFLIWVQFFAFLGLIPIAMYNGKKGKKIGNIYYSFYALHLGLFYLIKINI